MTYTIQIIERVNFAGNERALPRKYFKKFLPTHETIMQKRWLRPFGSWLHNPKLWHLHRRSVASGVAIGLFCGLIPGPFQMMGVILVTVVWGANLPVALLTTIYTNPFTIAPIYLLAYQIGAWVTGENHHPAAADFALPHMSWSSWHTAILDWVTLLGKPLAVGLPVLAIGLAIAGYFIVRLLWYGMVVWKWRQRAAGREKK